jgi:excisionase family DNA binding protein
MAKNRLMDNTNLTDMRLLSVRAAAGVLAVSRSEAYKLISLGHVPSVRIGNNLRVPLSALRDLITVTTKGGGSNG